MNPLKWHGGKRYLADAIVCMMPKHLHYVEPYAGGLAVLFAKDPRGVSEVVNDISGELMAFWRTLQDPDLFCTFYRTLQTVPFSEEEYRSAKGVVGFFVRCRQSMGGAMKSFAPLSRARTRGGMNEQVKTWLDAIDGLSEAHARLRRVAILNRPATEVIRGQDGPQTVFYLDPPYLTSVRVSPKMYNFEMTDNDHRELLETLTRVRGKWFLSGYHSPMYDSWAAHYGYKVVEYEIANHAAGGLSKRRMVECVWRNE